MSAQPPTTTTAAATSSVSDTRSGWNSCSCAWHLVRIPPLLLPPGSATVGGVNNGGGVGGGGEGNVAPCEVPAMIHLANGDVTVGRLVTNTVMINSPVISRNHAIFRPVPSADGTITWRVTDLKSSNGIHVNETKIAKETPLHAGDVVALGMDDQYKYRLTRRPSSAVISSAAVPHSGEAVGTDNEDAKPHQPVTKRPRCQVLNEAPPLQHPQNYQQQPPPQPAFPPLQRVYFPPPQPSPSPLVQPTPPTNTFKIAPPAFWVPPKDPPLPYHPPREPIVPPPISTTPMNSLPPVFSTINCIPSTSTPKPDVPMPVAQPSTHSACAPQSSSNHTSTLPNAVQEEFTCTICQQIFDDPCTLECGHSFCMKCITTWKRKQPLCPMCRTKITTKLRQTIALKNTIELLRKTGQLPPKNEPATTWEFSLESPYTKPSMVKGTIVFGEPHNPLPLRIVLDNRVATASLLTYFQQVLGQATQKLSVWNLLPLTAPEEEHFQDLMAYYCSLNRSACVKILQTDFYVVPFLDLGNDWYKFFVSLDQRLEKFRAPAIFLFVISPATP
ncbi:tripartite motif-containing protein 65 [Pelomyxa schiedti]|nr:tripartite motif-containing protein 65 [Pelomyxa schiedti]